MLDALRLALHPDERSRVRPLLYTLGIDIDGLGRQSGEYAKTVENKI